MHLGPLYIGGDKGGINPLVMMLFRKSDKQVRPITPEDPEWESLELDDEADDPFQIVRYAAPAAVIRDRLDLLGFTLQASQQAFDAAARHHATAHAATMQRIASSLPGESHDEEREVLGALTASVWMEGLREIRDRGLKPTYRSDAELVALSPLLRHMLGANSDGWYGFPSGECRHVLRLAVEVCPTDDLIYDLTDLVIGGYYDSSDDVVADADDLLTKDVLETRRIIVLTEGATDKWILENSLALLRPHLADFFTFMDFEGARVAGGAGALAAMVKAFVGAGILNRVVALFDNDTAARVALRSLEAIAIPRNIAVLQYPRLDSAASYPTIGPTGLVNMDVNGFAGGIELYLGDDVLSDGGVRAPVQWKGFDESVRQYQGELIAKRQVLDRFRSRLAACEAEPARVAEYDWDDLLAILDVLCTAFHRIDEEDLVAAARAGE